MPDTALDLAAFFSLPTLTPETIDQYADAAYASYSAYERFEQLTSDYRRGAENAGGAEVLRLAVALFLLNKHADAYALFSKATDNALRRYYAGHAALALGKLDEAVDQLEKAADRGWDAFEIDMVVAAVHVRRSDLAAAEKLVKKNASRGSDRGEWYFVQGLIAERNGDKLGAIDQYERALSLSPDHAEAAFRSAWIYDLCGDDAKAIELYQRLALQPRASVNALINLAVIYEDLGRFEDALECLRRVLRAFPNHTRARLFLKDVESCLSMVIDEAGGERVDPRERLLATPITEFELSVRARNCLKKMRIQTLGELIKLSEAELMAFKNFGETSLTEIKAMLAKRNLKLGQDVSEIDVAAVQEALAPKPVVPPGREAVLSKSVSELDLSVRARRCLQRLNINTLADLVTHSEQELLSTRNFGITSLNEIKARIQDFGLTLPTKRAE